MSEREFSLKYTFENVEKLEDMQQLYSPQEKHFGVDWRINILKKKEHLAMFLYTNVTENQKIHTARTMKIFSKNKEKNHSKPSSGVFQNKKVWWETRGWHEFIEWKTLENEYLDDGKLEVEIDVRITKMLGFPEEILEVPRKELRSFGVDMKQFSDVTLKYLSSHSSYFAALFLGKFQESQKSEIELKDVDPQDFQYYLEVLHLENGIDEDTVQGILSVADMFDTPKIVKKCEEFLVKESKKGLKEKLELAGNYRLEELKKLCLGQIKSRADISSVIPEDLSEMDPKMLGELLKKALIFN